MIAATLRLVAERIAQGRERKRSALVRTLDAAFASDGIDSWSTAALAYVDALTDAAWALLERVAKVNHASALTRGLVLATFEARARHEGAPVHRLFGEGGR